jgi:6-phosphogluconate dehydrogenase
MVPAAVVDKVIDELKPHLSAGDILIDGGNSYYGRHPPRQALRPTGIHYVDVGTSGGVWGLERGYCLMIGGEPTRSAPGPHLRRPGPRHRRHPAHAGRSGELGGTAEQGYLHCGPSGAGHFVKMVHNGIEYG